MKLALYDGAHRALDKLTRVDEVKQIRDQAVAVQHYARQAKDTELIRKATDIRLRAERRAGELLAKMAERSERHAGKAAKGSRVATPTAQPKLADLGINKTQSSRWQQLAGLDDDRFENLVAETHAKVERGRRNAMREVELELEREAYRGRTEVGCTVDDLEALAASGKKFGVICPDFPWPFEAYSRKGNQRSAEAHYDTWPMEKILAFGALIRQLAADDCALFLWGIYALQPAVVPVIEACGFEYKSLGFLWLKTKPSAKVIKLDGDGLHTGMGVTGTRASSEACWLATRGSPLRLNADVDSVVIAPVTEHSAKPDEVYRRIEQLYPGPRLELFARKQRPGWHCWGDEIPRAAFSEAAE
jgi:N6-adenosine-specific RNA methylase IME4